jgi:hypothetical protein
MQWEYVILSHRNLISVRASGPFSPDSFEEMIKAIQSDEQWRPNMDRLVDLSSVDLSKTTAQDILATVEIHKRYDARIGFGRIAAVFGRETALGLGRMYEVTLGPHVRAKVRSFRTADEARHWLAEDVASPDAPVLDLRA